MAALPALLQATIQVDNNIRTQAQQTLEQLAATHIGEYLANLTQTLADETQAPAIRQAAGVQAKNQLTAKDVARSRELQYKYTMIQDDLKERIKENAIRTLTSKDNQAGLAAAQLIAAIAAIEIPTSKWPQLVPLLVEYVTGGTPADLKVSTLQTIGYICEGVDPDILEQHANSILTAVIHGSGSTNDDNVRFAGLQALYNSLDFCKNNFANEAERNIIMQTICEATQAPNSKIQVKAFECLVSVMHLYYDSMKYYMEQALFMLTIGGMDSPQDEVVLQAIEFWSTVCEEEIDIKAEIEEYMEDGSEAPRISHHFVQTALDKIIPSLLQLLKRQDENAEDSDWNPAMAAATCIALTAQNVTDQIIPYAVSFIEQHIGNPGWRDREAAVMSFGSILEGPSSQNLSPLTTQILPTLLQRLTSDSHPHVKDTSAWTVGKICELQGDCIQAAQLEMLTTSLLSGLRDEPKIAANCAWAFRNLGLHFEVKDAEQSSYALSRYFEGIAGGLIACSERYKLLHSIHRGFTKNCKLSENASEDHLRFTCIEAIVSMIEGASLDCLAYVESLLQLFMERLDKTFETQNQIVSMEDRSEHNDLQSVLISAVAACVRRLGRGILPNADRLMQQFLTICGNPHKHMILEDVFLAVEAVLNAVGQDFVRYLDAFVPFLSIALEKHEEHQLCSIAVGFVGDLTRQLENNVLPYIQQFMGLLFSDLQSDVLHRSVKPLILSCFGDIALAIGSNFVHFLEPTMIVLGQASKFQVDATAVDYETLDYMNALREAIAEAYTGVIQGLKQDSADALVPYVSDIMDLIRLIAMDGDTSVSAFRCALGLLGDISEAIPAQIVAPAINHQWVSEFLNSGLGRHQPSQTKKTAKWTQKIVAKVLQ